TCSPWWAKHHPRERAPERSGALSLCLGTFTGPRLTANSLCATVPRGWRDARPRSVRPILRKAHVLRANARGTAPSRGNGDRTAWRPLHACVVQPPARPPGGRTGQGPHRDMPPDTATPTDPGSVRATVQCSPCRSLLRGALGNFAVGDQPWSST